MLQCANSEESYTLCRQGVYEDSISYLILYEPKIVFKFFINRAEDLAQLVPVFAQHAGSPVFSF